MLAIIRWSNGGITLKDLHNMTITDYQMLKHAIVFLQEKEEKEIKKRSKV